MENGVSKNHKFSRQLNYSAIQIQNKNWVEMNDNASGVYNSNSQIKFKTTMLKTSLCDYSDAYIHVKRNIKITVAGADAAKRESGKKKIKK